MAQTAKFRGRLLVLAGILLVALTLRTAVTAVPPIATEISADLPLDPLILGILGMTPTLTFAFFGFLTPFVICWTSLERLVIMAMLLAALGQIARVFAPNTPTFLVLTVVALAGLGAGNVLLPPLVKQYFPAQVDLVTGLYVTALALGTALPAQIAVPVADTYGWQVSLATWAGASLLATLPWMGHLATRAHARATGGIAEECDESTKAPPLRIRPWRSPLALGLTFMFGCTSLNVYAMYSWLPHILTEAGVSAGMAGTLLALYAAFGLPLSLLVPLLGSRLRNPFPIVAVFIVITVIGYCGLLFSPGNLSIMWVLFAGAQAGIFPLSMLLINLRTRTQQGAGVLSGFSQGVGYALACTGPLLFGALHSATGTWQAGFLFLFVTLGALVTGAFFACRPAQLEDKFRSADT